jgi:phospholipid/cholesterol/gamma-HCH transport system substrate-binding protein
MNTETNHRIKLGIFVFAGSILLIMGLYLIGKNRNLFGNTYTLIARFDDIGGLQPGNNVRFSGIDVGTVDDIEIINDSVIEISMSIVRRMETIIRENSVASIGTDGLMGNKLINLEPGTTDYPLAAEGSVLPSVKAVDTEKMLRTLETTNLNVEKISSNLIELTSTINLSRGTLYTMLMDTTVAKGFENTLGNIESISVNLNHFSQGLSMMSNDVRSGKGTLGALINDTGEVSSNLKETMAHLHASSERIEAATLQINDILKEISNGKGSANALLKDTVMAGQLRRSIQYIDSSAEKLNQNMEALKHNFLTRGYFKKLEKEKDAAKDDNKSLRLHHGNAK